MLKLWRFRSVQLLPATLFCITPLFAQKTLEANASHSSRGYALFESNCGACHGSDGRGGERAPDIAISPEVQQLSNSDLMGIIRNGISGGGMPGFSTLGQDGIKALVDYMRVLQDSGSGSKLPGDPHAGEVLFFGKAQCSSCHMVNGKGGFIASDLTFYGTDKTPDQIRNIITEPDKYLSAESKPVTVVTSDDQKITGVVRNDDNFSISLQTSDGSFHFFKKSYLRKIEVGPHSLMPGNYASTLGNDEVNDLVSYVINVGKEDAIQTPQQHSRHREGGASGN